MLNVQVAVTLLYVLDAMDLIQNTETQHKNVLANLRHGIMEEYAPVI
jgi:hypothetical protein